MMKPYDKALKGVICPLCGREIANHELYYTTDTWCVNRVVKNKISRDDLPILRVCCDCVSYRYIEESLKYDFNIPYLITTDDFKQPHRG